MAAKSQTLIVVPIDGSENSLRSLDYINLMLGSNHQLKVTVFHVLPYLPTVSTERKAPFSLSAAAYLLPVTSSYNKPSFAINSS
jgi:hypothetical protein